MPRLLLGTMRVAPRWPPTLRGKIERGIRLISRNPLRWPKFDGQRRRLIVRKFPYAIIYELHSSGVVILAVAHGKRRPNYWRERAAD